MISQLWVIDQSFVGLLISNLCINDHSPATEYTTEESKKNIAQIFRVKRTSM